MTVTTMRDAFTATLAEMVPAATNGHAVSWDGEAFVRIAEALERVATQHAVAVLNRAHEEDPSVLTALIDYRVPCNQALADDPTIQVGIAREGATTRSYEVGLLGIVNGIFGIDPASGWGYVGAQFSGDRDTPAGDRELLHFDVVR